MDMVKGFTKNNSLIMMFFILLLLSICVSCAYASDEVITNIDNRYNIFNDSTLKVLNGTVYVEPNDKGHIIAIKRSNIIYINKQKINKRVKKAKKKPKKVSTITIVSKPSCGCRNSYKWHKRTFVNYCPYCKKYEVLTNLHKYPARHEQEISCKRCRADFCGVCGKEKYSWSRVYLRRG